MSLGEYHAWSPIPELTDAEQQVVDDFHKLYYRLMRQKPDGQLGAGHDSWLGYRILKCPLDLMIYQEILFDTKPDIIIETGTFYGGSALFLATMCQLLGRGRVITIDIQAPSGAAMPRHPLIEYRHGYSQNPMIARSIKQNLKPTERVMVILDANHRRDHVLKEIANLAPLVSLGCYLIVEDSNFNGHPVLPKFGPGPMEAITEFIAQTDEFTIDKSREKQLLTFNPCGYLLRTKEPPASP